MFRVTFLVWFSQKLGFEFTIIIIIIIIIMGIYAN